MPLLGIENNIQGNIEQHISKLWSLSCDKAMKIEITNILKAQPWKFTKGFSKLL